jgi:Rrf2 family protein
MRITTWAEYGLICALHLARRANEGPITGREIAAGEKLPADYVEQILLRLRRAGIVKSTRGARGGYALGKPADQLTVRDVITASELQTFELQCVAHPISEDRCGTGSECSIRPVWQLLQLKIDEVLASVRLSDLVQPELSLREPIGLGSARASLPVLHA